MRCAERFRIISVLFFFLPKLAFDDGSGSNYQKVNFFRAASRSSFIEGEKKLLIDSLLCDCNFDRVRAQLKVTRFPWWGFVEKWSARPSLVEVSRRVSLILSVTFDKFQSMSNINFITRLCDFYYAIFGVVLMAAEQNFLPGYRKNFKLTTSPWKVFRF